jgi:drug/metabolite transporter (DMT)-like permease
MFEVAINVVFAVLAGIGTIALGLAFRQLGALQLSASFLWSLVTNKWFILSVLLGFSSIFLRYAILKAQGLAQSSYYLQTSLIAVVILSYFILGEQFTLRMGIGAILIFLLSRIRRMFGRLSDPSLRETTTPIEPKLSWLTILIVVPTG